ncbi:Transcription termination factor MTERF5 [Durusdinium trenchii]|uniref:Chloroplastic (Mitochondrial transcription termination factor 5) (mTERF5) (Protein MTERF DEFECTIVE IN ARABIDOPSIS 1) n=1 Tax=Durusdinium trenchii TaxID=1381693 RepID=A0ABP0QZ27_9DINO
MRSVARCLQHRFFRQLTTVPPAWWRQGWSRQRAGSVAEAELLAPLAQLLMPRTPPLELFRSFPSPPGWAGNYLEPDLAAHGTLRIPEAALFIEYDGYWRHGEKAGFETDQLKNAALLAFAPPGSKVIRVSHTASKPVSCDNNVLWFCVGAWRRGDQKAFLVIFNYLLAQTVDGLQEDLNQEMLRKLQGQTGRKTLHLTVDSKSIVDAATKAKGRNTREEISSFLHGQGFTAIHRSMMLESQLSAGQSIDNNLKPKLQWLSQLGLSKSQVAKAVAAFPKVLGYRIEQNLKPKVQWLLDLGLNKTQIAKAVACKPQILGYSIEQNLKPTVQWLGDLGLTKTQVAKTVATSPAILGLSIEQNLKPTVQWLLDLGLTKTQVAKTVATSPAIIGLSIEQNLKPTVQWLLDLGLSKTHVAKAVATSPAILGYSMERNLKPTVQWLLDLGLSKTQVAKTVARKPNVLGYSIEQNLKPTVQWMLDFGLTTTQVAKVVATSPANLGLSIEQNLKPTVQWLLDLSLSKAQVANAVASKPQILGYSIEKNLKLTVQWLLDLGLSKTQVVKIVASKPQIFGYSIEHNLKPTVQWLLDVGLSNSQIAKAVTTFPPILGLSIEKNCKPKCVLLFGAFGPDYSAQMIARFPQILSYSRDRLTWRLSVLAGRNETMKLAAAMSLSPFAFQKRFLCD